MRKFTQLMFAAAICTATYTMAQERPTKTIPLGEQVVSLNLNPVTGVAVVEGDIKVYGVTENTQPLWAIKISDIIDNSLSISDIADSKFSNNLQVQNIYGSKLVVLTKGLSKAVVDTSNGKVIYSSKKNAVSPINHQMVKNTPILLISSIKDNLISTAAIDLKDGRQLWETPIAEKAKVFDKVKAFLNGSEEVSTPTAIQDNDKNIYAVINSTVYKFDASGKVVWSAEKSGISNFDVNKQGNALLLLSQSKGLGGFLGVKESLDIIDTNTGQSLLKSPMSVDKVVYMEDLGDRFMLGSFSGTNIYNYQGQPQWRKKIKGDPKMMVKSDGGYIFVTDKDMNFVDANGAEIWKRDVEISDNKDDQIFELREANGRIFYITSTYANIVDKASGKKIWKKDLKLNEKRPTFFTFDDATGEYVVYNDEKLYKFDANTTERPDVFAKVNVKKEKEIAAIEKRKTGYLITGLGEIILVNNNGEVAYQKLYQEPGAMGRRLSRVGLQTLGVLANLATSTVESQDGSESGLFLNKTGREDAGQVAAGVFALDQNLSRRFNASKEDRDFIFYFTKDGDNKVLVKVNKDTGAEEKKFLFKDNKPKYTLDDYDKTLYYATGNEVNIFKY